MNAIQMSPATADGNGAEEERGGGAARRSALSLVSETEWRQLEQALASGIVPADLEMKLARLSGDNLVHGRLRQNCRLLLGLLDAAREGAFRGLNATQHDRLTRVLAYVRKDDDAIPDFRPDGFIDDHREVQAVCAELQPLLREFKCWRLRHLVPQMWHG